jgi:hypothetical protein
VNKPHAPVPPLQQSTINNQQSTINNQQSTINNQQSTIHRSPFGGLSIAQLPQLQKSSAATMTANGR